MSSNIRINKICLHCGADFIAKTTATRYCTHRCNSAAYKAKIRGEKVAVTIAEITAVKAAPLEKIKAKEFLTVKDVASLLNCSKRTAYRLISTGTIPAINLSERKTLIRKSDVDKLFEQPEKRISVIEEKKLKPDECFSISEVESIYGIKERVIHEMIKRNNITKIKNGRYTYVAKESITKLLGAPEKPTVL